MIAAALAMPLLLAAAPAAAADTSPAAARAVVERYYAAIDRHDYRAAYAQWDRAGAASGQSYAAFAHGFARTRHARVTAAAPTDQEGAAGSVFITVPVRVEAVLVDGTRQRFAGHYALRRVNGVDGATPAQLAWHLDSAKLRAVR